jgi:hypothetical protein
VSWAVDQDYPADRLRVLAAEKQDPEWVRAQVVSAADGFGDFVRGKGRSEKVTRPELSIELVGQDLLCREEVYREPDLNEAALAQCQEARHWYRVTDSTLLVATGDQLARNLAVAIAEVMCITAEPEIPGCGRLPGQFAEQHK